MSEQEQRNDIIRRKVVLNDGREIYVLNPMPYYQILPFDEGYFLLSNDHILKETRGEVIGSLVITPGNIDTIAKKSFSNQTYLRQVELKEGVIKVEPLAFENCKELESVIFPKTLQSLGDEVFRGCRKLKEISLPGNCRIGENVIDFNLNNVMMHFYDLPAENKSGLLGNKINLTVLLDNSAIEYGYYTRNLGTIYNLPFKVVPYCKNIDDFTLLLSKNDEFRNMIDFSIFANTSALKQYSDNQEELINYCNEVIRGMLDNMLPNKIYTDVLKEMNYETFIDNMNSMMQAGFSVDESIDIIINNNILLSHNINGAFKAYQNLLNQKLITSTAMDNLFFNGEEIKNIEDLKKYYIKNKKLPELFNTLLGNSDDKGLQELRDRLTYICTLQLLDGNLDKRENAKQIIKRDLFQSITAYDQQKMQMIEPYFRFDNKPNQFAGIYTAMYRKMNGIAPDWFSEFMNMSYNNREELSSFLQSLETVKGWNDFSSEKERAEFLKNEIVGRLLYADLCIFANKNNLTRDTDIVSEYKKARKPKKDEKPNYVFPSVIQLIKMTSSDKDSIFNNSEVIKAMLNIDPYSFDALREIKFNKVTKKSLEINYILTAYNNGYYLSNEDIKKYQKVKKNLQIQKRNDRQFIEYLNNGIEIPFDDSKVVDKLEESIKSFVQTSNLDELYNICNIFDFYLRHSKEYDVDTLQGNDFGKDSKTVFDRNSTEFTINDEMPRVLYCLFNLNKLSKHDYDFKVRKCDDLRLEDTSNKDEYFGKRNQYRRNVELLQQHGINYMEIKQLYKVLEENKLLDKYIDQDISIKILNFIDYDMTSLSEEKKKKIKDTISNYIKLCKTYPEDVEDLDQAAREQSIVYKSKDLFIKYAIQSFGIIDEKGLVNTVPLSRDEKIAKFKELQYAVEIQEDERGKLVLACYFKGSPDSFSIHLDNSLANQEEELRKLCNSNDYLIKTTKISDRLRLDVSAIDFSNCSEQDLKPGFNSIYGLTEEQVKQKRDNVAYSNAITFGLINRNEKKSSPENLPRENNPKESESLDSSQSLSNNQNLEQSQTRMDDRERRFVYSQEEAVLTESPNSILDEVEQEANNGSKNINNLKRR